jgi:hypothetical protein
MQPTQQSTTSGTGNARQGQPDGSSRDAPAPGQAQGNAPTVSLTAKRSGRKLEYWDDELGGSNQKANQATGSDGPAGLSAAGASPGGNSPASPYRPPALARHDNAMTTTSCTETFTTTTTTATTTTSTSPALIVHSNATAHITGATVGMPLPANPAYQARRSSGIEDAQVFNAFQQWEPSEGELVGIISDRDREVLIEDESAMICAAARQPSTLALEMLQKADRGIMFAPYTRATNRGWHEEHCPFLAAIDHSRPENLRLLLKNGARPGAAMEMLLSAMPAWVKDIFREYGYML